MLDRLKRWIGGKDRTESGGGKGTDSVAGAAQAGAGAFEEWLDGRFPGASASRSLVLEKTDEAFALLRDQKGRDAELDESFAADAACLLGEEFRRRHGGEWTDSRLYGPHLAGIGGIAEGRFHPMAVVERKWASGKSFTLAAFYGSLSPRIEAEQRISEAPAPSTQEYVERLRGRTGEEATQAVAGVIGEFREFWRGRYGISPPLSLTGIREVDGFLRSHYYVSFLSEGRFVQVGMFLGEVGRGLFDGEWDFSEMESVDRAALRFPELDYYPVGRIYKMMTERPAGEPLDEYLRLIPSARKELREQAQS